MNHVLIAEQAALPALLKRLERLSGDLFAQARVVVLAQRPDSEITVTILPAKLTPASLTKAEWHWVPDDSEQAFALNKALRGLHLPQGQTQAWVACPSTEARLIRRQLIEDHGVLAERIECAFYASVSNFSSAATASGLKPAMM